MNNEIEIQYLKTQINNLADAVIQLGRNSSSEVGKREATTYQVMEMTPYKETKTAYIGDTEISFENVPRGNLSVFADNISEYRTDRVGSTLNIDFINPLEEVTEVTISIQ